MPVMRAEGARRTISPDLFGAMAVMTPMLIPTEPMFPKPHNAYEAMVNARGESGFGPV
jgi:hypothetical protein